MTEISREAREPFTSSDPIRLVLDKCEQYWNEHNIPDEEMHAILEYIHREVRALDRSRPGGFEEWWADSYQGMEVGPITKEHFRACWDAAGAAGAGEREKAANLSDKEINRRVAKAMGFQTGKTVDGTWRIGRNGAFTQDLPDFLHDWQARGRLWEWIETNGWIVNVSHGAIWLAPRGGGPGRPMALRKPGEFPLALAFLEAVDQ